jgi:hypothetical protein
MDSSLLEGYGWWLCALVLGVQREGGGALLGLGVYMRLRGGDGQNGGLIMLVGDEVISRPITDESCSQMCCSW